MRQLALEIFPLITQQIYMLYLQALLNYFDLNIDK